MPWWAWCRAMVCLLVLVGVMSVWTGYAHNNLQQKVVQVLGLEASLANSQAETVAVTTRNIELTRQLQEANSRINSHPWWKFWSW